MDQLIQRVLVGIDAQAWSEVKGLLHPYLHWTGKDSRTIRGRANVLAYVAEAPSTAAPERYELRDGQIYRWVEGA